MKLINNQFEIELTKMYYSIGEVAEIFNVNTSLIRFWEKEFDFKIVKKNTKGNRLFSQKEILLFNRIYDLVKNQGFTLEGAKKKLTEKKNNTYEVDTIPNLNTFSIIQDLEHIKSRLKALKNSI